MFQRQPAPLQDFILKTSILDRLTAPLCDAVAEREGSHEVLPALEQANLFIVPLDDRREWYRYHRLFRDLLRTQRGALDLSSLHQKAARWYERNGFPDEAMTHALAAEDWDEAERMMGPVASEAIKNGQFVTLSRWLDAFPDMRVRQDPELAVLKGWALLTMGQFEAAATYADLARDLLFQVQTVDTPYGKLAGVICCDLEYPYVVRQLSQKDVDILLVPSFEPAKGVIRAHAQMAPFRAIENGLSIFRSTVQGVSLATDPYGRVLGAMHDTLTDEPVFVAQVPNQRVFTIYPVVGDLFGWLTVVGFVVMVITLGRFRARGPQRLKEVSG